ncbi:hypothetical protein TRM7615_04870 [Falsiruegeria mediterranea M17]|uniref:Uncharacterized protein n=1 Tax=Falsiruegeria mediterranea M17 TaxID=1200281 RepID=A0A2R8CFZ3_9RHOB|nr:hypothetical protein TRM7615_04870 [Falsiruegeria mediterranea M17]
MTRLPLLLLALSALMSCAEYQEPKANCFAFRASAGPADPSCVFTPLGSQEDGVEI